MIERSKLLQLLHAARAAGRRDVLRALAADWLAFWPGDVEVQCLLARAEYEDGMPSAAAARLARLVDVDPEYSPAYDLLGAALRREGQVERAEGLEACRAALRGETGQPNGHPAWAQHLGSAVRELAAGRAEAASLHAHQALAANPPLALPTHIAVRAHLANGERSAAVALARTGAERWPAVVSFRLLLADEAFRGGETARAVDQLHRAVSDDPLGRVARAVLGADHPYRSLWPESLQGRLSRPIPAELASEVGAVPQPAPTAGQPAAARAHEVVEAAESAIQAKVGAGPAATEPDPDDARTMAAVGGAGNGSAVNQASIKTPPVAEPPRAAPEPEREQASASAKMPSPAEPAPGRDKAATDPAPDPIVVSDDDLPTPEPWEAFRGPNAGPDEETLLASRPVGETLVEVRQEMERLAERLNVEPSGRVRSHRPAYIVLSSRTRLMQAFGSDGFLRLDDATLKLAEAARRRPGWSAYRVYIDDPSTLAPFDLPPADPGNAWQIKLRLADLDAALGRRGESIGSLLIVGGHEIVPHHLLPNPTDDDDVTVPSDNPYANGDENYFLGRWPVGRLPSDRDLDLLVRLVRAATEEQLIALRRIPLIVHLRWWLAVRLGGLLRRDPPSFGYTADIWRKASMAVYRPIGNPASLVTSPPVEASSLSAVSLRPAYLSYYNLHGLEDAPEWFGQRDPLQPDARGPEFPVALRPQDVVNGGRAPGVVYTEACYGGHTLGKSKEGALCLKFLDAGSRAVIGSTKISYGSVTPPLIAADLLGRLFWEHLRQGLPVGEALRRAKLDLALEMDRRQGFLDGEDQKTLISFVLYGDPLYTPYRKPFAKGKKFPYRPAVAPRKVKTACALGPSRPGADDLDPATLDRVKSIVTQYLPGMRDAECRVHPQHCGCDAGDHVCPSHQLGMKSAAQGRKTTVVTFAKQVPDGDRRHSHFARLTLDSSGKVLKLAVSR